MGKSQEGPSRFKTKKENLRRPDTPGHGSGTETATLNLTGPACDSLADCPSRPRCRRTKPVSKGETHQPGDDMKNFLNFRTLFTLLVLLSVQNAVHAQVPVVAGTVNVRCGQSIRY